MQVEFLGENHFRFKSIFMNTGFCLDCDETREIDEHGCCSVCKSESVISHGAREGLEYNKLKKEDKDE